MSSSVGVCMAKRYYTKIMDRRLLFPSIRLFRVCYSENCDAELTYACSLENVTVMYLFSILRAVGRQVTR